MVAVQQQVLKLYPLNNEFIGFCESENNVVERDAFYQTVIVMDRSESMGDEAERLVQKIFPLVFAKLAYQPGNAIQLIAFDTISELHATTVDKISELPIFDRGNTYMQSAMHLCRDVFSKLDRKRPVRLLTISDGEVYDQPETTAAAAELKNYLNALESRFVINSNAVRLFTSDDQPDTTAISSLLQLNNGPSNSLAEVKASESDEVIANKIVDLFLTDNHDRLKTITASKPIFKPYPWDDNPTSTLTLPPGENVFWMTEKPENGFDGNGTPIETVVESDLNADQFEGMIRAKFEDIVEKIKVMQIIGSTESKGTVEKIKQYFQNTLKLLPPGQKVIADMTIFKEIERIANDQTVTGMSQQKKADYLLKTIALPPAEKLDTVLNKTAELPKVEPQKPAELPAVKPQTPAELPKVVLQTPAELPKVEPQKPAELPKVEPQKPAELPKVQPQMPAELPKVVPQTQAELPKVQPQKPAELPKVEPQKPAELPEVEPQKPAEVAYVEMPLWSEPYKFLKKVLRHLFAFVEDLLPPEYKHHTFFVVTAVFSVFAAWMFFL